MLAALGARFLDADGEPVAPGGGPLRDLATADLSGLDPRLATTEIVLASDVDNPLTGPKGAPAVYGPQKGASEADVATLDAALAHYAEVLERAVGPEGRGTRRWRPARAPRAASATARWSASDAAFRPGIDVMLDVLGFAAGAGRGHLRHHRRGLARRADPARQGPGGGRRRGPCGRAGRGRGLRPPPLTQEALGAAGIRRAYALTDLEPDPARCMAEAGPLLERAAEQLARDFLV